ncbi:SUN domain-containing protein 5, partial [Ophiophagus hannah]
MNQSQGKTDLLAMECGYISTGRTKEESVLNYESLYFILRTPRNEGKSHSQGSAFVNQLPFQMVHKSWMGNALCEDVQLKQHQLFKITLLSKVAIPERQEDQARPSQTTGTCLILQEVVPGHLHLTRRLQFTIRKKKMGKPYAAFPALSYILLSAFFENFYNPATVPVTNNPPMVPVKLHPSPQFSISLGSQTKFQPAHKVLFTAFVNTSNYQMAYHQRKSQHLLEEQFQEIQGLKKEMDQMHSEIGSIKKDILQSTKQILEESDLPGEKKPDVNPGNCWAFSGSDGQAVIKLPEKVQLRAITVQHIPKAIAFSEGITSALKDFLIYGLNDEIKEEILLGTFMYDTEKELIQTFQLKNEQEKAFQYVKIKVQSNWGNPEYTCIYRVRVHGKMASINLLSKK